MVIIKAIEKTYQEIDEFGQVVTRTCLEPETPIPATAVKTEIRPDTKGGMNYYIYEQGEI